MIDNLSIGVHAFALHMLTSFSVDEILLPRYVNWSINFKGLPLNGGGFFLFKTHELCFICVYVAVNAIYCLLQGH